MRKVKLGKPTGVILLAIFLIVAFIADFSYGGMMLFGILPIPTVYAALGVFYAISLVIGGMIGMTLFYGLWNLKNWARLILQIGFPDQVIFNIIIDHINYDNYFLLAINHIVSGTC